MYLSPPPPPV
ncbi:hypothetical protein E2C01_071252 [Portunus trituberculatus]|uniref:Uncharacterized protein n=1 Tax=Portunus trituberculatus TaxID=210409 RepID=A0A5B7HWH8_PORTR|nr:hypothetical protein [Portunus trituberculatus]